VLKFATAQIIAASLGDQQRVTKAAHRAVFQYEARPGYLYVRSRAISSRCNDNFDEFPAEEIAASYKTFVGKPVFVNHVNDNHRRARGVIIDAALHHDRNPDGSPDTWAEVLMEIDATRFPKLAKAILAGHIDRTSMGCDVERSVCSACGNEARTPADYCSHIPHLKGKRIFRATAGGKKVGELVRETCFGLRFFENSVLVEPPADPTAHFLGVDTSGLGKAASKTAATDYSQFEDHDDLEGDDDGEDAAPHPKPAHPVSHAKPAVPHVPFEGTTENRQRREDAVSHSKPFTPLKPSLNALQVEANSTGPFSWDEIGERHPHVYGDPEYHGEAAEGADGEGIGWAANHLAHNRPDDPHDESSDVHSLEFHLQHINPQHIDFKHHGGGDGRVENASRGYAENPEKVPPLVLVHRHGVYQVADGHHRAQAAYERRMDSVPAYVAHSPHPRTPFGDGSKGPFHGAEPAPRQRTTKSRTRAQAPAPAAPQWEQQKLFGRRRTAALEAMAAAKKPAPKAAEPELDEYGTPKPKRGQPYEPAGDHPWYKQVPLHHDHIVKHWDQATPEEKDSGMRWYSDAHHVAKAIAKLDPSIKTDEEASHKGAGVLSAYSPRTNWPMNMFNAAHSFHRQAAIRPLKDDPDKPAHTVTMGMHADKAQRIMDGEHHQPVLKAPKTQDFAHLIEHGGYEPQTDEEKKSGAERRLSGRVVVDRHALSVAAGRRITDVENDAHQGFPGAQSGKHARHYYEHAANTYRNAAAAISEKEGKPVAAHQVQAVTWLVRQRLNTAEDQANTNANTKNLGNGRRTNEENIKGHWKDFAGEHAPELKEQGNSHVAKVVDAVMINADGSISALAYGEIKAPADVDTLREENCPVCGDKDTFDGIQCQICGFINPPEQFRDPDLDKAKQLDLRKQIVDPSLVDNNGELQRVNDDGTGMPQQGEEPGEEQQLGPDGQPLDEDDPQMVDPDQLDENGLPPSPFGDQALDGTQQMGPAVSDRNGDGMIQPDEIDPDGNVNAQPQLVDPEQGGQAGPRELPGRATDRMGDPFTPGPDMPRMQGPEGPEGGLQDDDDDSGYQGPGMGSPQEPILAHPGDYTGDESETPHWSWNRDVSDEAPGPEQAEEPDDPRRRRFSVMAPRTPKDGQPSDGVPDLNCLHCGFGADATAPQTQDMGNAAGATDGIVAGDVCPNCRKAQLLTPAELQGKSSVPPPAVPQLPRT
jgi:hypothetical protein